MLVKSKQILRFTRKSGKLELKEFDNFSRENSLVNEIITNIAI